MRERKKRAREEWMRETERGQSEQVSKRGMDRRMDGKEREKEQRDALVRHAMLGWNQVRPT